MAFSHDTFGLRMNWGDRRPRWWTLALGAMSLATLKMSAVPLPAIAQSISALPACAAPGPEEYLLLVVLQTEAAQSKLIETLPPSVSAPTCNYLGSRVARMGGFQTPEDADAWASYLRDAASLPAFVAKPTQNNRTGTTAVAVNTTIQDPASLPNQTASQTTSAVSTQAPSSPPLDILPPPVMPAQSRLGNRVDVPQPGTRVSTPAASPSQPIASGSIASGSAAAAPPRPPAPAPTATAQAPSVPNAKLPLAGAVSIETYEPKGLSDGYAVLVDYGNQTSLVPLLRQLTKQAIGLASYGQRPFLLVNHTSDSKAALTTLNTLNKSGFRTMLVDSGQVVLLTSDVQVN